MTGWPAIMVKFLRPETVRTRSLAGTMAESLSLRAMCAEPTVTGTLPNGFVSWRRRRRPPMLVWAIIRTVWLLNSRGAGGRGGLAGVAAAPGGVAAGAVAAAGVTAGATA